MTVRRTLAAEQAAIEAIHAAEARRQASILAGDVAALGELFSDDLVYIHTDGRIETRAVVLAGRSRVRFTAIERRDVAVIRREDYAIMTGRFRNVFVRDGAAEPSVTEGVLSQVWIFEDNRWRMILYHASRSPAAPRPPDA